jgi:DNA-binding NarL/FixJ family response regulator
VPAARRAVFEHAGQTHVVFSVPCPTNVGDSGLSPSEQDVFVQLIAGRSRDEIAADRGTSPQTVSCQLRAIFAKLRFTGRYAAIRRAAERGWFDAPSEG